MLFVQRSVTMDIPAVKLASKDTENNKMTSKEIREEYFNQLRSWLITVNSYQCYYNKLQQKSLQNIHERVATKNPTAAITIDVPNVIPETPAAEPVQFVGRYASWLRW